jgi:hypothetical protein
VSVEEPNIYIISKEGGFIARFGQFLDRLLSGVGEIVVETFSPSGPKITFLSATNNDLYLLVRPERGGRDLVFENCGFYLSHKGWKKIPEGYEDSFPPDALRISMLIEPTPIG